MGSCEHDISFSLDAVDNFIDLQYGEGPLHLIKQEVSSFLLMTETLCLNYRPSWKFNFYLPHQSQKPLMCSATDKEDNYLNSINFNPLKWLLLLFYVF